DPDLLAARGHHDDFSMDHDHVLHAHRNVPRADAGILPCGEVLWRFGYAHHLPPSAAELPDTARDLHALCGRRRHLLAHRPRLSRLWPACADAVLGAAHRSSAAIGES